MSSQIHANPQPRATPTPAAGGAATPAAVPAKPAPAPRAATPTAEPPAIIGHRPAGHGFLRQMPGWLISMVVHIIVLLAMALVSTPAAQKQIATVITSSQSEADKDFEEFEDKLEEQVESVDVPEIQQPVVPSDVAVVEDVKVIANADDLDAAPLAVELTDFGSQTAPAADMLSTVGAVGAPVAASAAVQRPPESPRPAVVVPTPRMRSIGRSNGSSITRCPTVAGTST